MAKEVRLGICFFDNRLFFAVGRSQEKAEIDHIGAVDFNFDVASALFEAQQHALANLGNTIRHLKDRFNFTHLNVLLHPRGECRTILPKIVYDNSEEREAHINILMSGVKRKHIHTSWHSLSNEKYWLLKLQTDAAMQGIENFTNGYSNIYLASTFEIGRRWMRHANPGGSFLTVCCYKNCIDISSYILGKLRGTTYITFDHADDLPYLWLQQSNTHTWMKGLHEQIQIFGFKTGKYIEILKPFLDDASSITKPDSLKKMNVTAREKTYGFDLAQAYPAVMLTL